MLLSSLARRRQSLSFIDNQQGWSENIQNIPAKNRDGVQFSENFQNSIFSEQL